MDTFKGILAGITGGVVFFIFLSLLNAGLLIAGVLGLAGFTATLLMLAKKKSKSIEFSLNGITREDLDQFVEKSETLLRNIQSSIAKIKNQNTHIRIKNICGWIEKIIDNVRKDPKDVKIARQFLPYYMETTIRVIDRYSELYNQNLKSTEIQETLRKAENLLFTIEEALEKQNERLLKNDVLELSTDIDVLEKTIKMDGF